jgi:putative ABC transport system permease protein
VPSGSAGVDHSRDLRHYLRVTIASRALSDAFRFVSRSPSLVASVTGTLTFAIAGVVAILALINAIILRPLPFPDARQLYIVHAFGETGAPEWLSLPTFADWQKQSSRFESLTALTIADFNVLGGEHAESILAVLVSSRFFDTMGIRPARGRMFADRDYTHGTEPVVILSHSFWQRRFGGDAEIVGRTVRLAGPEYLPGSDGAYTVIGIMPESVWLFWKRFDVLVPLPASAQQATDRNEQLIERVFGRLRPGGPTEDAQSELTAINAALRREFGREAVPASVVVKPAQEAHFADVQPVLVLLGLAGAVVLVLAAVNVTTILLAHGLSREREFAVRTALGARRVHFALQGGLEGLLLVLPGGALGVLVGYAATGWVGSHIPRANLARIPGEVNAIGVDGVVVATVVPLVLVLGSIVGIAMMTSAFRRRLFESLRQGGTGGGPAHQRIRSMLVGVQLALSLALVLTSWVLLHNLVRLGSVDLGVQAHGLVSAWVNLSPSRFPDPESRSRFYERVIERGRTVPGIVSVGAVDLPFRHEWQTALVRSERLGNAPETSLPRVQRRAASGDYFAASGIPLLHGRTFESRDAAGTEAVAVVNRRLAEQLWTDTNPLGQRLRFDGASREEWLTVVGVVGDVRAAPHLEPALVVYRAIKQAPPPWIYLMARTSGDPLLVFEPLKHAIWQVDRDQPVDGPWLVSEFVDDSLATLRFVALLAGGFTILGAIIAAAGIYSVTAFAVNRSTREIGVRKALGATTLDVICLFVRRCVGIAAPAFLVGLVLFDWQIRAVGSHIPGVRPEWDYEMSGAVAAFALVVLVATLLPARRAAHVEPTAALRAE